jgi:Fe-Mn family superoxide dismutase
LEGSLKTALERDFGSIEAFKNAFSTTSAGVQGSGWGWLGYNKITQKLEIATTPNQDPLLHLEPLLGMSLISILF